MGHDNTILVTGANGFVGRELCKELLRSGHLVKGVVRSSGAAGQLDVPTVAVGEIGPDTRWEEALEGVGCVIHLAARVHVMRDTAADPLAEFQRVNVEGTKHLAQCAASKGVRRFVYVSSIKVNGEETGAGRKFTENDDPAPMDPYGVSKWQAEQALARIARETGLEVVIVRPPLVYGAGVKGNFIQMLRVVARGLPLPLATVPNRRSLVYVGNLVDALVACALNPAAAGKTFLVSDPEAVSTSELLRQLAAALGVSSRLFPCPPALLRLAGRLSGKTQQVERLLGSLEVDSAKIRRDLDWVPPYSLQQGLRTTAEWYRNQQHT